MRTIAIYYSLPANNAYTRHAVDYFTLRDKPLPNRANCELAPNDFAERAFVQHNKFERLVKKQFHHNSTDRRQSNVKPKSTHETRHSPIETALIGDFIGDFDAVQQSAFVAPGPYLHNWHAQLQNPGGNITTHTTHAKLLRSSSAHGTPGNMVAAPICNVLVSTGLESKSRPTSTKADAITTRPRAAGLELRSLY